MRITYLHQYFNTPRMPGSIRSYEFAKRLVEAGHTVNLITTTRDVGEGGGAEGRWHTTIEDGITVHWYPIAYSNYMSFAQRIRAFVGFALVSTFRAANLPTDIIFATSTPLTIGIPGILAAKVRRVPMVFEVRDLWPDVPIAMGLLNNPIARGLARLLERASYANSTRIIALSPDMKTGIVDKGVPADQITVVPNASDMAIFDIPEQCGEEFRSRYDWLGGRPLIVYAGTFGLVNGLHYLVNLASAVGELREDVRFLLIGSGAEFEDVIKYAGELGVMNRNLFIMPTIGKHEVARALSAATICCSTVIDNQALWANSANKVFDALGAGRPVFINHKGWQKSFLEESGAGVALHASDIRQAAHSIVGLLEDESELQNMRQAAKDLASTKFSRDVLFEQFKTVLEEALGAE